MSQYEQVVGAVVAEGLADVQAVWERLGCRILKSSVSVYLSRGVSRGDLIHADGGYYAPNPHMVTMNADTAHAVALEREAIAAYIQANVMLRMGWDDAETTADDIRAGEHLRVPS